MSWINRVRNAIPFIAKRETPDNLWHKCPGCAQMIFVKEYEENLSVCPKCGHHGRIGPKIRFAQIFDDGRYHTLPNPKVADDPLKFRDSKKYTDRIKAARAATGEIDALINGVGTIQGNRWAWASVPPSSPAFAPRSPNMPPMSSSRQPAARACRRVSSR
jgi:acetyl-CoA carboxylase carboxyl transferase subunit beta